jgi:hypothetical protein
VPVLFHAIWQTTPTILPTWVPTCHN